LLALGIETTCDETAAAVVRDGREILSNVIFSQEIHTQWGGVVPELASRGHAERIDWVIERALDEAKLSIDQIDLICVAKGPGLMGALLVGLNAAKGLAVGLGKPLMAVNHIEAHLYAAMMEQTPPFPALGVVLSGGHTSLVRIDDVGSYTLLGATVDDAIGEAFDKVAALLELGYPGGPKIEKLAKEGDPSRYTFHAGRVKRSPLDFSFSGLKTNVLYTIKGAGCDRHAPPIIERRDYRDVAAAFQETAFQDVRKKMERALDGCRSIVLGGGVTCNRRLREIIDFDLPTFWPPLPLCLDNGAMIAGLGSARFLAGEEPSPLTTQATARLGFAT